MNRQLVKNYMNKKFMLVLATLFIPFLTFAQKLKINDISEIEAKVDQGVSTGISILRSATTLALAIGVLLMINALVTDNPKKKDYVIGFFIALVLCILSWTII